jgi:photosystem II stability/assembly factor-like uncharacterized protein
MKKILFIIITIFLFACGEKGELITETDINLWDVHFSDLNKGTACGESGLIIYTKDGGNTWYRAETNTESDIIDIQFTDKSHGWAACGDGFVLKTDNGGKNWKEMKLKLDAPELTCIQRAVEN